MLHKLFKVDGFDLNYTIVDHPENTKDYVQVIADNGVNTIERIVIYKKDACLIAKAILELCEEK